LADRADYPLALLLLLDSPFLRWSFALFPLGPRHRIGRLPTLQASFVILRLSVHLA
jgi:hypothetical protein